MRHLGKHRAMKAADLPMQIRSLAAHIHRLDADIARAALRGRTEKVRRLAAVLTRTRVALASLQALHGRLGAISG